jgi:hypothetical protein
MKLCTNCGAENHKTATYCITCGLPLSDSFPTLQQVPNTGRARVVVLLAVAIAIAGFAVAIFMFTTVVKKMVPSSGPTSMHDTEISASPGVVEKRESVSQKQILKNVNAPGKYLIDDQTLSRITTIIKHFIHKNNGEDVEAILEYFNFPINRYHRDYNVSRVKLKAILKKSLQNADEYHSLKTDFSSGTVSFDGRKYEVVLPATYIWASKENASSKQTRTLRLKYILNKNLQFTSVYEM